MLLANLRVEELFVFVCVSPVYGTVCFFPNYRHLQIVLYNFAFHECRPNTEKISKILTHCPTSIIPVLCKFSLCYAL